MKKQKLTRAALIKWAKYNFACAHGLKAFARSTRDPLTVLKRWEKAKAPGSWLPEYAEWVADVAYRNERWKPHPPEIDWKRVEELILQQLASLKLRGRS